MPLSLGEEMSAVIVKKKKIYLVISLPECLGMMDIVSFHFKENILDVRDVSTVGN